MSAQSVPTSARRALAMRAPAAVSRREGRLPRAATTAAGDLMMAGERFSSPAPVVANLRAAAAADDREFALGRVLSAIGQGLAEGRVVEVLWPGARDNAWAAAALGLPLSQSVLALTAAAAPGGSVVIHTRAGSADDFLALAPSTRVSFVFHLNSEEAALRWERGDASPGRRLAAAARLNAAGWTTWVCIGAVRLFDGWREEYTDIAERAVAAGFSRLLVSFPGEDLLELTEAGAPDCGDGVQPVMTDSGCRFTIPARQRREVQSLISSRLPQPARAAA